MIKAMIQLRWDGKASQEQAAKASWVSIHLEATNVA